MVDRETIHVRDMAVESEAEFPEFELSETLWTSHCPGDAVTARGYPIGAIMIRRTEVRPFSDKQIALLKTFA